jgi:hypothetical protein
VSVIVPRSSPKSRVCTRTGTATLWPATAPTGPALTVFTVACSAAIL